MVGEKLFDDVNKEAGGIARVTVDGSEIRLSPVEVGGSSYCLQGFTHPRWLFGISEPSTVS